MLQRSIHNLSSSHLHDTSTWCLSSKCVGLASPHASCLEPLLMFIEYYKYDRCCRKDKQETDNT